MKNKPNKLYLCYAGTGKSYLAKEHPNFIDLDSSAFTKDDNWVGNYCRVAKRLLKTHNVLMSCHLPVRKYLTKAGCSTISLSAPNPETYLNFSRYCLSIAARISSRYSVLYGGVWSITLL